MARYHCALHVRLEWHSPLLQKAAEEQAKQDAEEAAREAYAEGYAAQSLAADAAQSPMLREQVAKPSSEVIDPTDHEQWPTLGSTLGSSAVREAVAPESPDMAPYEPKEAVEVTAMPAEAATEPATEAAVEAAEEAAEASGAPETAAETAPVFTLVVSGDTAESLDYAEAAMVSDTWLAFAI